MNYKIYCTLRASYSRSTVLTYMTLFAFSGYGYNRASYYRYNKDTPGSYLLSYSI